MKHLFFTAFLFTFCVWGNAQNRNQFELTRPVKQTNNLLSTAIGSAWPMDINGVQKCALVRVTLQNFSEELVSQLQFKPNQNSNIVDVQRKLKDSQLYVFMTPGEQIELRVSAGAYGSSNILTNLTLETEQVYDLQLINEKTLDIRVFGPNNARAKLDGFKEADGNNVIRDVTMGTHKLSFIGSPEEYQVEVTEENREFDFRKRSVVSFKAVGKNISDVYLFTNETGGYEKIGTTPFEYTMLPGTYTVKAISNIYYGQEEEKTFNVPVVTTVELNPVKQATFSISASYDNKIEPSTLKIDGNAVSSTLQRNHTVTLPIGTRHSFEVSTGNGYKRMSFDIKDNMENILFKIPPRRGGWRPWDVVYEPDVMGFSASYVRKQMVTQGNGEKFAENGAWVDGENKWLNGVQLGLHFQPEFGKTGLGVYTGLFYEMYISLNSNSDYTYLENQFYVPVHLMYRFAFARRIALSVHVGPGFSAGWAKYTTSQDYEDVTGIFGENEYPKVFNISLDAGASLKLGPVQLNAQYSKGLNNHKSYAFIDNAYKTHLNKWTFGISYVFGVAND